MTSGLASDLPERDPCEGPLRRLVSEIAAGSYRDALSQRLTLNTAYLEAVTLLELQDTLEQPQ